MTDPHAGPTVGRPWSRRLFLSVTAAAAVAAVDSGCSLLGGPANPNVQAAGNETLEKAKINVSLIPCTDVGPLWLAKKNGYFAAEGLDVTLVNKPNGPGVISSVFGGDADFGFATYPVLVQAQLKTNGKQNLRVVADASAAKPDTTAVVVKKGSSLSRAEDLKGKRIAVTARGTMADLAVMAGLRAAKVDWSTVDWKQIGFADMLPKLESGEIDAAFFAEPYVTIAQAQAGVTTVFQPLTGALDGIPLSGYMATEQTTKQMPKTVAAFQRAIRKAQTEAATQQGDTEVKQTMVDNANVQPDIAPVIHLPSYPISADPTRLQRVPDLMQQFGLIGQKFDIKPMILPQLG
jgi:NitT/TauT family transport system substrate-binding protein